MFHALVFLFLFLSLSGRVGAVDGKGIDIQHQAELERTSTQLIYFDFITSGCSVQRCQGSHGAGTHHHHFLLGSRGGHDGAE